MKTSVLYLIIWACLITQGTIAQNVPAGISYQAVARDGSGNPLDNQPVSIKITLRDKATTGAVLYEEKHVLTTDAFGLFTLAVGQGSPLSGAFDTVNWGSSDKFLQIAVDPAGGNDFIEMGATRLLSVPYALYAKKSADTRWRQRDAQNLGYAGDVLIGGSTADFDGPAESLAIRGRSKEWHIGVENKEDAFGVDSGFFISQSVNSDGTFHIFENGTLLVPRLHIKQPSSTGLILQNVELGRGWRLGTTSDGKLLFSEGRFSDAGSSTTFNRLAITGDGKVGIGNFNLDDPTHELHMVHASTGDGGATAGLKIENEGNNHNWWSFYTTNSSGELELYYKGSIRGEFDPSDGQYRQRSDGRLKRSVAPLLPVLEKLMKLQPSTYYFKDSENHGAHSLGFIAQEVQPLFPELVGSAGEDEEMMTLNYDGFSILAIKAIQEQQVIIKQLQQRIESLEKLIKSEK